MATDPVNLTAVTVEPLEAPPTRSGGKFVYQIVGAAALGHLLNDMIQAVLPAIYPMLKEQYQLSFTEIGLIAMCYQFTASLLQPLVGWYTDKHPMPYLLPFGMVFTFVGVGVLGFSSSYPMLLLAAITVGIGSATFHPEASRAARSASGGRFGTAQSSFQVGGNTGSAIGPLLVAAIVAPHGQTAVAFFMIPALLAILVLSRITVWTLGHGQAQVQNLSRHTDTGLEGNQVAQAVAVVCVLMFAKFVYIAAFTNYFTFYLIQRFALTTQQSQIYLFIFLAAIAVGTFAGGPVGDRIGRKAVIWVSFLGVAPFALALPYANLHFTAVFAIAVGLVMSSAFSALVVYAQEAVPGRVGTVSGLMFGLMFGIGGIAAAGLGKLADAYGIVWVYQMTSYLPLLGLATAFLPTTRKST